MICYVPRCGSSHSAKGLCNKHYLRMRTHGTLISLAERLFWQYIEKKDQLGCWPWSGPTREGRYGVIGQRYAHRFAYELLVGPIPRDLEIDHLCRNRLCVNPDHLEPVTHRENILRGISLPARRARQNHCKNGHAFTTENTYFRDNGNRTCRTCHCAKQRDRKKLVIIARAGARP